ncbi:MAG: amidase [Myxococcales bacterium]|nr:amidase [Myxococcales bacterium]
MNRTHGTNELSALTATEAKALLEQRKVSSVELVDALFARIEKHDRSVNAFTERFEQRARAEAQRADEARARGDSLGALHGLPVTVKESIEIEGSASTLGIPSRTSIRAAKDAPIVAETRRAGGIVLGRTNVPQLLLSFECRNPVFGQCANPRKLTHSPGGSSGGEAAALVYGGSMLGIGTDIGGSIRLPAHFSGCVGFKPTQDRLPNRGLVAGIPGQEAIRSQCGPMARSVDDIALFLRALDMDALSRADGRTPPMPFGALDSVQLRGVRVGLLEHDGILAPSRANIRAVRRAGDALERAGVEVVPFVLRGAPDAIKDYFAALSSDGANTARDIIGDAPVDVTLQSVFLAAKLPAKARLAAAKALEIAGQSLTAMVLRALGERSVAGFWKLVASVRARRFAIERELDEAGIDALLLPPFATAAVPHTFGAQFQQAASYTMLFNFLHWPAGVVPVTTVRADECDREATLDAVVRRAREVDRQSLGLPIGVQVATRAWKDELCLALLRVIEEDTRNDDGVPARVIDP